MSGYIPPPTETARFARGTFWLGVAQALRFVTSALLLIIIPNLLPEVADYGRLSLALSLCGIFAVFVDFGLSEVAVRDIPRDPALARGYLNNILGLKLLLGTGVYALITVTCFILGYPGETITVVLLIGGYTVVNSFCVTINHQFRSLERMDLEAAAVAIQNALIAACVLTMLFLTRRPVPVALGYLLASVISCAATALLYRGRIGTVGIAFDSAMRRTLTSRARYFLLSNIVLLVYLQIDVVMLGQISGERQVGFYQAAARVVTAATFPAVVILGAAVPQFSRLYATAPERFNNMIARLTRIIVALMMPLAAATCIFCNETVALLFGPKYEDAGEMLRLLSVALLLRHIVPYRMVLSVTGHQSVVFAVSLASAVVNIALNAYLIPAFGGWGAGVATVITCAGNTIALAIFAYRRLGLQVLAVSTAAIVTSGALFADAARRFLLAGLQIRFVYVIITYLGVYAAFVWFAALSGEDRRHARRVLAGIRARREETQIEAAQPQPRRAPPNPKRRRRKLNAKRRKRKARR